MRRLIPAWIRVPVVFFIIFGCVEYMIDSGEKPAFLESPNVMLFLFLVLLILIAIEAIIAALENVILYQLDDAAKARFLEAKKVTYKFTWLQTLYKKLVGGKPIEKEGELILDHNYDGIKELDNSLPPWWLYGFYATIIFGAIYLLRYHVFNGSNQYEELEIELAEARLAQEEYKKTAKNLVDAQTVSMLLEPTDLSAGKAIYEANCVACHMADGGGGIGPNMTDQYWILGGDIKSVFRTISEGGRSGKGMIPWKQQLKPLEMAQVASYILTFQGSTPENPKTPEGNLWISDTVEQTDVLTDSLSVQTN